MNFYQKEVKIKSLCQYCHNGTVTYSSDWKYPQFSRLNQYDFGCTACLTSNEEGEIILNESPSSFDKEERFS